MSTAYVYIDGVLVEKSVAYRVSETIETELYDGGGTGLTKQVDAVRRNENGFTVSTKHLPVSAERIPSNVQAFANQPPATRASIYDEPVENTGLSSSGYGDGYYSLGSGGGYYYAPNVYGYLYRKYTKTYLGETAYWQWGINETIGAIMAYISLFGGPVGAVIDLLVFVGGNLLAYSQAVRLATHNFVYDYRVRVSGSIQFETYRDITYWRVTNETTGVGSWDEKSFNYGFSSSNSEMIRVAIDNYLS